ncbi:hypothetical protein GX411_04035 [Candidatus Fermentibacteria bacterium]|nr:hypothetical protein [Candidatus Fermentibacteria bacterium]
MYRRYAWAGLSAAMLLAACGRTGIQRELELVPSTALAHFHAERPLPPEIWGLFPEGVLPADQSLFRNLLDRGPLGVSIVAVSLTDLEPQLLLLTRSAPPETLTALACASLGASPDSSAGRTDLVNSRGQVLGAVAERDGWSALYLGPAPQSTLGRWLEMKKEESLASDSSLALLLEGDADLSLFVPSGLISFLRVAPVGEWIPEWSDVETVMSMLQPRAARLDLAFGTGIALEARVVRQEGRVARTRFELEDTGFTPGEMLASLQLLLRAGGLL